MGVNVGDDAGCYAKIEGSQTDMQQLYRILLSPCLSRATGWLLGYFLAVCLLFVGCLAASFPVPGFPRSSLVACLG
jgi:hypothetical protein